VPWSTSARTQTKRRASTNVYYTLISMKNI
jgi:hypothetical protein